MAQTVNFDQVRPRAQGQWLSIIEALAPALSEAVAKCPRHVPCPVHGGKDGFRLYKNANDTGGGICNSCGAYPDGFALLAWANGWTLPETLQAVAFHLGIDGDSLPPIQPASKQPNNNDRQAEERAIQRKRELLRVIWRELIAITEQEAKPARDYLINRGLGDCLVQVPSDLFYHPRLAYWHDGQLLGKYPALVAVVRSPEGEPITLHRTYLTETGKKADVPTVKKLMSPAIPGSSRGGAIRLYPADKELILAEGIETALALHIALNKPSWACVSAGGLESVDIPAHIRRVVIGADNDASKAGQNAALTLCKRLIKEHKHIQVKTIIPECVGHDWLDVFNGEDKVA